MKNPKKVVAPVLAASLAVGLAAPTTETPDRRSTAPVSAGAEARYTEYFDAALDYWDEQGVPNITDTKIRFVTGDDAAYCTPFYRITSGSPSQYCDTNDTVTITGANMDGKGGFMTELATIGHEVGHAVEDKRTTIPLASTVPSELGATCLSGSFVRGAYPERMLAGAMLTLVMNADPHVFGGDGAHGTMEQQQAAWLSGLNGESCAQYNSMSSTVE